MFLKDFGLTCQWIFSSYLLFLLNVVLYTLISLQTKTICYVFHDYRQLLTAIVGSCFLSLFNISLQQSNVLPPLILMYFLLWDTPFLFSLTTTLFLCQIIFRIGQARTESSWNPVLPTSLRQIDNWKLSTKKSYKWLEPVRQKETNSYRKYQRYS